MKDRILELSKKHGLSHIGSCVSVAPILEEIYQNKGEDDLVVLDNGHAHLAHLVAREEYEGLENIEDLLHENGIHCDRSVGCDVSTGSLGHGLGIGLGLALANKGRDVHVVVSDGSMAEGSNWEALRIKTDLKVDNLKVYVNANGWSAYGEVNLPQLEHRMEEFDSSIRFYRTVNDPMPNNLSAHYDTIK